MDFSVHFLSFFVIQTEGGDAAASGKTYKHYRTMDGDTYEHSEIKHFLDGEFTRICKRKVEKNPNTEQAPTKIGRFIVEPGHELDSNPNYNLFQRLRLVTKMEDFKNHCDDMIRIYMETSAVRGGAFIVASARLTRYFEEPFLFVMKCDFEPKVARISDETSLVAQVDMAISARSMKSIQYPFMPEEGMLEEYELKVHQASHARYFEDFLKYVSYEKSKPEIVSEQVIAMVQEYMEQNQLLGTSPDPAFAAMQGQGEANTYTYGQSAGELGQLSRIDNPEASGPGESYGQYGQNDQYDQSGQPGELGQMAPGYQGQPDEAGEYEDLRTSGDGNMERQTGNSGILHAAPARNQWSPEQAGPGKRGQDNDGYEAWERERQSFELWAYSEKRDLQEKWDHTQVVEAAAKLTEHNEELELKFRLDGIAIKGNLADYGNSIHIARHNGRYVVLIEGDQFQFDKGVSPIELLKPEGLDQVIKRLGEKADDGLPY